MRKLGLSAIVIVCAAIMLAGVCLPVQPLYAEQIKEGNEMNMQAYVNAMQPGWNMGNTFDATGSETSWGNPPTTKELIEKLASQGYKSIRIPITWKHRMGDAPDYSIDGAFMDRIQEVVDWSLDAGLYVMINLHHDSHWIFDMESNYDDVLARYKAAWVQIADRFKDYPMELMFEGINEPRFSDDWGKDTGSYFEMLDVLNTSFHHVVRSSGGSNKERPLVLSTLTASASQKRLDELSKTIAKLDDNRIIATVHYYGFYPFSVNLGGVTTFNEQARNDLIQTFDRVHATFVAKGIPVIVGEFGLLGFDKSVDTIEQGEKLKYFEYLGYYAKQKQLTTMLWDNGQHYDRRTFEWKDPELYAVMEAALSGRSSTASTDQLFVKRDAAVTDQAVTLQLNGNAFTELRHGDRLLEKGVDYELNGDSLKIKAGLIESLLTEEYGVQGTLAASFSAGSDWHFDLIRYHTPILRNAEGTSGGLSIPTAFKGDRLATMEAAYASGGNTAPNEWTPYKEMAHSYKPAYDLNEITLTKEFLEQLKDGEVKLRMHFWSGEIVDYAITKTGSAIVGVSSNDPEATQEQAAGDAGENDPSTEGTSAAPAGEQSSAPAAAEIGGDDPSGNGMLAAGAIGLAVMMAAGVTAGIILRDRNRRRLK
ncbi:cellulase family glycosylhydrolase [Paenibacillus harenae]|uniref:Aryl-phospho-beta-D-glucosidase BglC (GH1 family) n=1 Tax=Paenibacillus harenae TaxID=306543 RepID=A0ABT9TX04_PAEHA|nr:cellulase family glycosylhydrolase [Paenibacillus harenae]MDQ0111902.1 aryl-phospho-beta-D-glucosidase BglC (GH1 family) [Paenibacillus harenae]